MSNQTYIVKDTNDGIIISASMANNLYRWALPILPAILDVLVTTRSGRGIDLPATCPACRILSPAPEPLSEITTSLPSNSEPQTVNRPDKNMLHRLHRLSTCTTQSDSIQLWHRRLAHLNPEAMKQLLDDTITFSSLHIPEHYSVCVLAKHKQSFIRTPMEHSRITFELIHSDVCGPMLTLSLSKACYYIVYIDNATRFARIFFLKSKSVSAVLPVFKEYMAWVDAQGFHIKRFQCDNGTGEFDNNEFRNLLALSGITFELAPPFTQHKNGTAERYIQTINGNARRMMLDSHMPHWFWAEAVNTATYLHSISLTKTLIKSQ
jgi:hypothetical protein